jgi:tetratricopeptide (TPR) repeat protein
MSDFESLSLDNQDAIEELAWTLNASRGEFKLVIVRCNYAQLRDRAIVALRERVENVAVWMMPAETTTLLEGIRVCAKPETVAVMVVGLDGATGLDELLSATNRIREEFRSACPFPVMLWVTDAGLRSLMRSAPDFESWGTTTHLEISIEDLDQWMNARIHEWITGELSQRFPTQMEWADLEQELIYTENRLREENAILSEEFTLCWSAILGSVCHAQWKTDEAITLFETALSRWKNGVWNNGKAKVLEELVRSYHIKSLRYRDRNHPVWSNLKEILEEYLDFFNLHFPDLLPYHIPTFLGEVLLKLERWNILRPLAKQASEMRHENGDTFLNVRPHGYLAEVAVNSGEWEEALVQANQASTKLKLVKSSNNCNQILPPESINILRFLVLMDEAWYRILVSKAYTGLGQLSEAIQNLEEVRANLNTACHSLRYLEILTNLEALYRSQHQYLKAFETKQERFALEQQMNIRAFVGAGWLRPQRMMNTQFHQMGTDLGEETIASAIRSSGRSQDIQNLLDRIGSTEYKLTILHGASGVGKSSLVEGGLVPALRQKAIGSRDNVPVLIRQYTNWVEALLEALGEPTGGIEEIVLEKFRSNEECNLRTILIFDQFEEFFFVQRDRVARQRFYTFLRDAIELSNVKVILSLREDYLHYLLECRSEMSMINDGDVLSRKVLYEIGNFSPDDARSIIKDLTERSQFTLEPALLDRMVADLAEPLKAVRPIELQIVGAQLQAEGIRALADYPVGGKTELVDRYLMATIADCGEGNEELAELVGYLLTDDRGTRPLKTRDELVREMSELKRSPLPGQLDLVLAVLVGSGLVMRLKALPDDRYQLVHDYLAGVIRDRQKPQFDRLAKELDEEKEKNRKLSESNVRVQRQVERGFVVLGGIMAVSAVVVTFASQSVINANQQIKAAQDQSQALTVQAKRIQAQAQVEEKKAQAQVEQAQAEEKKAQTQVTQGQAENKKAQAQVEKGEAENKNTKDRVKVAN